MPNYPGHSLICGRCSHSLPSHHKTGIKVVYWGKIGLKVTGKAVDDGGYDKRRDNTASDDPITHVCARCDWS